MRGGAGWRRGRGGVRLGRRLAGVVAAVWLIAASGCATDFSWRPRDWFSRKAPELPDGPAESFVLRGGDLGRDKTPVDPAVQQQMEGAHTLRREEKWAKAEEAYHYVANTRKIPMSVLEES